MESKIEDLINKKLENFTIKEMIEIYMSNEDGKRINSVAVLKDPIIAEEYTKFKGSYYHSRKVRVLTNEKVFFIIDGESVISFDDEDEMLKIRNATLDELSPIQLRALGLTK